MDTSSFLSTIAEKIVDFESYYLIENVRLDIYLKKSKSMKVNKKIFNSYLYIK